MKEALNLGLIIVAGTLILIVLIQPGKSDGLSSVFTGSGDLNLFAVHKERGAEKVLARCTVVLVAVFFVLAGVLQIV